MTKDTFKKITVMKGSFKIVSAHGIHMWIHWTFLLLVGWVILATIRYATDVRQIAWSIFFIIAAIVCVTLHELGHAVVASLFGIQAKNIILLPVGGIASIEKFPDNPAQELAISIAGPLVNVIIALLLWGLTTPHASFLSIPDDIGQMPGQGLLYILRLGNIGLAAFNLIPAFPMDGGRILRALLGFRFNYIRATAIAGVFGKIIAITLIGLSIVLINPMPAIIGIFILLAAGTEEYYLRLRSLAKGIKLNEVLMYDFTSLQADMTVQEAARLLIDNHNKYFILMDGDQPAGALPRLEIVKAIAEMRYGQPLRSLVKEKLESLDGSLEVNDVLEKLARDADQVFPVMNQGIFAGIVNLNYVIEYLLLHSSGKEYGRLRSLAGLMVMLPAMLIFSACGPSVKLTASWTDTQATPPKFTHILVMAIGKDLAKRKIGEDAIRKELHAYGYNASTSLDELGPGFAARTDSAAMQRILLDKAFDGVVTVRVLDVNERGRWVPGGVYYGPDGFYRGFYGYYHRVWGYYTAPAYEAFDVEVLLESNLYEVLTSRLLWSGQSKSLTQDPTPAIAARYARNIVEDMIDHQVLTR